MNEKEKTLSVSLNSTSTSVACQILHLLEGRTAVFWRLTSIYNVGDASATHCAFRNWECFSALPAPQTSNFYCGLGPNSTQKKQHVN